MIRTTVLNGGDIASYRDPDHPTQLAIVQAIDDLAHEQATNLAIDGCGAPLYAISLYAPGPRFWAYCQCIRRCGASRCDGDPEPSRVCVRHPA